VGVPQHGVRNGVVGFQYFDHVGRGQNGETAIHLQELLDVGMADSAAYALGYVIRSGSPCGGGLVLVLLG